jgi:hypothetical protein
VAQRWERPAAVEAAVIVMEPKVTLVVHEVAVTEERLVAFEQQWTEAAESHKYQSGPRWTGCDLPYYPCEFIDHCHRGASLEIFYQRETEDET